MSEALSDLKLLRQLQAVILWYLALLGALMLITWVSPASMKEGLSVLLTPVFFGMFLMIPFSLLVFIMTLYIFRKLVAFDSTLRPKAQLAGWAGVVVGIYILGYFFLSGQINNWAYSQSHSVTVIVQSSPVVLGLILLATHVFVVRSASAKLKLAASA